MSVEELKKLMEQPLLRTLKVHSLLKVSAMERRRGTCTDFFSFVSPKGIALSTQWRGIDHNARRGEEVRGTGRLREHPDRNQAQDEVHSKQVAPPDHREIGKEE